MKYKASIEAKYPPPHDIICIRTFSTSLSPSNIWYQTWRLKCITHVSYLVCLGFKPRQAVRPSCLSITQSQLRSDCLYSGSSKYAETVSLNKQMNAAAVTVFWHVTPCTFLGRQVWVSEKYAASNFRVEYFLKSWNNYFWHLKRWSKFKLIANRQWMVITRDGGRRA
jgi:hypothetical protein